MPKQKRNKVNIVELVQKLHKYTALIDCVCLSVSSACYIIHICGCHGESFIIACLQYRWTVASASNVPVAARVPQRARLKLETAYHPAPRVSITHLSLTEGEGEGKTEI